MTDPQYITSAILTVIGSLTAAAVTIINTIQGIRYRKDSIQGQEEIKTNTVVLVDKADQIHSLVNGAAEASAQRLKDLQEHVEALKAQVRELRMQLAFERDKRNGNSH